MGKTVSKLLADMGACDEGIDWVNRHPDQSPADLWATCPRGDWMWWVLCQSQTPPTKEQSVEFSWWCVRRAEQYAARAANAANDAARAAIYAADAAHAYADYAVDAAATAAAVDAAAAAAVAAARTSAAAASARLRVATAVERRAQADYIREHFTCPEF